MSIFNVRLHCFPWQAIRLGMVVNRVKLLFIRHNSLFCISKQILKWCFLFFFYAGHHSPSINFQRLIKALLFLSSTNFSMAYVAQLGLGERHQEVFFLLPLYISACPYAHTDNGYQTLALSSILRSLKHMGCTSYLVLSTTQLTEISATNLFWKHLQDCTKYGYFYSSTFS